MHRSESAQASFPTMGRETPLGVRVVSLERSAQWLDRGFRDFAAHPGIGLFFGSVFAAFGWLLTIGLGSIGMGSLILPLAGGFMLIAPLAAVGLYEVSRRRERGLEVTLRSSLGALRGNSQMADMGLVLLLIFFVWIELAMVLFALFYGMRPPALGEFFQQVVLAPAGVPFLTLGTAVGGVLAALAFAVSVVSMPMLMDRDVSALTAVRTSLRATWLNRWGMVGWAATLAVLGILGVVFFFAGLAVTLPIAAHASWHAYRDLVERG
ncbi:MAG: DUF2189 domain-containing protein [Magnetospirillum sp.]|nr:DUF2189 domain-containing protein [Magnetospirillum sp.]